MNIRSIVLQLLFCIIPFLCFTQKHTWTKASIVKLRGGSRYVGEITPKKDSIKLIQSNTVLEIPWHNEKKTLWSVHDAIVRSDGKFYHNKYIGLSYSQVIGFGFSSFGYNFYIDMPKFQAGFLIGSATDLSQNFSQVGIFGLTGKYYLTHDYLRLYTGVNFSYLTPGSQVNNFNNTDDFIWLEGVFGMIILNRKAIKFDAHIGLNSRYIKGSETIPDFNGNFIEVDINEIKFFPSIGISACLKIFNL